ncbi:MAG: N-acetylneuraminate synthase family protein, partial [Desulfarculus sp.]|nr:N-acetylneuraminate synthase family protein [Desulfarculus sp.]
MARTVLDIGGRLVGSGQPCFIIAEAGVNHNGSLARALDLVRAAAACGADAVKFQSFRAEEVASAAAPKAAYQVANTGGGQGQLQMLSGLELSPDDHQAILKQCQASGIMFLSTAFDELSVNLLDGLGMPAFKVPSGEITNLPLLRHMASKRKPLILSTGMSTLEEVGQALEALREALPQGIVLLHCISNYPAQPRDVNLRAMATMAQAF